MKIRDRFRQILSIKDSPHRLSISFAIGVFLGMSPLLGLHTVLAIALAWMFRLNKLVTISGVFVTNPWTIVPIYTFSTWVGAKVLGINQVMPHINWSDVVFMSLLSDLKHLLLPFVFGTFLVGSISGIISYFFIYHAVKKVHSSAK